MPVNILFLDHSIKVFNMGILLRVSGVVVEMDNLSVFKIVPKVFMELPAVVGLNSLDSERSCVFQFPDKVLGA